MLKKFYGFVGKSLSLPHMGEENGDYQSLQDEAELLDDDWDECDDEDEEDDFNAIMRKKERREAETFAWSVFGLGIALTVGTIFLIRRSLSRTKT